ncbi:unnamed protein product [Hymenolepis diminuta]|nr:unnamed protein product [Hymenolepis diminuta]
MDKSQDDQNKENVEVAAYVSKDKYKALVAEIRQWEDNLWHSRQCLNQSQASSTDENRSGTTPKRSRIRESLANVNHEHVSSLRKFWEGLMTQGNINEVSVRTPLKPIRLPSAFVQIQENSNTPGPSVNSLQNDMQRTIDVEVKHSPSEPKYSKTPDLPSPPPPPPAPIEQTDATGNSPVDISAELPPPPPTNFDMEENDVEVNVHSKSMDYIDAPESPKGQYFVPEMPSTAQSKITHSYYKRPRLGASALYSTTTATSSATTGPFYRGVLRNWPNSTNLNESPSKFALSTTQSASVLPRQRSVTFEPEPGSAPGDTEYEEDTEAGGSDKLMLSYSHTSHSAKNSGGGYTDVDAESIGILESAARLANSAERASRRQSKDSRRSSLTTAAAMVTTEALCPADDDRLTDEGCDPTSDSNDLTSLASDEEVSDSDSVNSEPIVSRSSARASKTSLIPVSPGKGRKSGDVGSRRISRDASALLDFDCPPTPITQNKGLSRRNTEIMEAEEAASLRRMERIKQISELLAKEKVLIMELSSNLSELKSNVKVSTTYLTQKSSKHHTSKLVDESALVDFNLQFLLACQRRQSLLDELSVLNTGSRVLIPPMRGEPLRARFQLKAIRLALKTNELDPGYAVVTPDMAKAYAIDGKRSIKYHLIAILKCVGEGRMYHTQVVTLMRLADLSTGCASPAAYVDLPASIDIVPLRPDFAINIEIYCLQTGSDSNSSTSLSGCGLLSTPLSKSVRASALGISPIASSAKKCLGIRNLLSSKSRKQKHRFSGAPTDLSAAFTLLSSVQIHHTDDLLYGRYPPVRDLFSTVPVAEVLSGVEMPLILLGLPRSTPLTGRAGMCDVAVRLQSSVLKRGFLTIFDESGGMGVWTRCWCKLTVDQLVYWRYPEDEEAGGKPIGRLDMRCIVHPWAVQAPRKICVRANSIYIRSLISISPSLVPLIKEDNKSCATKSILFHASTDNRWMEQRHLMCADSESEVDSWVKEFNRGVQVLHRWMPEHFTRLAQYDANLTCTEPVSAKFATRFKRSPSQ